HVDVSGYNSTKDASAGLGGVVLAVVLSASFSPTAASTSTTSPGDAKMQARLKGASAQKQTRKRRMHPDATAGASGMDGSGGFGGAAAGSGGQSGTAGSGAA